MESWRGAACETRAGRGLAGKARWLGPSRAVPGPTRPVNARGGSQGAGSTGQVTELRGPGRVRVRGVQGPQGRKRVEFCEPRPFRMAEKTVSRQW